GIEPKTNIKDIRDLISIYKSADKDETVVQVNESYEDLARQEKADLLMKLERETKDAAKALDIETAATLRDTILELKAA
ncbi:excinuclease ABC subunit B, partial [Enterococcus faecalis]